MSNLLNLLDRVDSLPGAAELRRRSYELLGDVTGRLVVDVGCGGGRAVAELGDLGARAVGVDLDEEMVRAARSRWDGDFRVGSALELPFEDGEVVGYRADKVLHTLAEPADALREARRVLTPGGRAVLLGQDWDTIVIDSDRPALTRRLVRARADTVPSPRVARAYRTLLVDAGFVDPVVEVRTVVFTDDTALAVLVSLTSGAPELTDDWMAEQRERVAANRAFVAVPLFLVAARR
ncbi:methyltransferase domain-containing protein [Actinophytocola xanthii]|uniref:SAM-dependent methyltransferase n=1 Tax=Actinophytocola xanthii TaxID=1912961 RepID=A0A1Q8CLT0_9PSEU|nr:methyltransferase domain-containing protein [Actinophytocola xanthii]OLF15318.1 SAM-dependent methyltransferase [Actinophytocola xanthii]